MNHRWDIIFSGTRKENTINHEYRDADGEKSVETLLKLSFEKIEFIL